MHYVTPTKFTANYVRVKGCAIQNRVCVIITTKRNLILYK